MVVLILDSAAIVVEDAEAQVHAGNLRIYGSVENTVAAANYGLVILEWIPGERDTGCEVLIVGIQRKIFLVDFVADPVVQSEIGGYLPRVLQVESGQRSGVGRVICVAEALLVDLR